MALSCWLLLCFAASTVEGMPDAWKWQFKQQLLKIVKKNPRYVWGGSSDLSGIDCSHFLFLAAKRAAIPGISYVPARDMANGRGGWSGVDLPGERMLKEADECDLPFWKWRNGRWHTGVFLVAPRTGLLEVGHASSTWGVVLEEFKGKLLRELYRVRRLTIGDAPPRSR